MPAWLWSGLFVCCMLAACTGLKDRNLSLIDTLRSYETAVRWGNADNIKTMHNKELKNPLTQFTNMRISSYTIQSTRANADKNKIQQQVEIRYYFLDQLKEKIFLDEQIWEFDDKQRVWLRSNDFPMLP